MKAPQPWQVFDKMTEQGNHIQPGADRLALAPHDKFYYLLQGLALVRAECWKQGQKWGIEDRISDDAKFYMLSTSIENGPEIKISLADGKILLNGVEQYGLPAGGGIDYFNTLESAVVQIGKALAPAPAAAPRRAPRHNF